MVKIQVLARICSIPVREWKPFAQKFEKRRDVIKKKLLSVILALAMVLSLMPAAFAAGGDPTEVTAEPYVLAGGADGTVIEEQYFQVDQQTSYTFSMKLSSNSFQDGDTLIVSNSSIQTKNIVDGSIINSYEGIYDGSATVSGNCAYVPTWMTIQFDEQHVKLSTYEVQISLTIDGQVYNYTYYVGIDCEPSNKPQYVAQIGQTKYESLEDALKNAQNGQEIVLLDDVQYATNGTGLFNITKSITLNGDNHSITGWGNRGGNPTTLAINDGGTTSVDVTLKNLTINNAAGLGRAVETRGNINSLTIDGCTFNCTGAGNTQGLTIGGSQATSADVKINNSIFNAGNAGYPIISFNPWNGTITGSTFSGYCGIYFKPDLYGSKNSVVNVTDTTFDCPNEHTMESQSSFGLFVLQDSDISLTITDCKINAEVKNTAKQCVILENSNGDASGCIVTIDGANTFVNGQLVGLDTKVEGRNYQIKGGTFTENPKDYVPENYKVSLIDGKYKVEPLTLDNAAAKIGDTMYLTLKAALLSLKDSKMDTVVVELLNDQDIEGFTVDLTKSAVKNLTIVGNGKKLDSNVENGNQNEDPRVPVINIKMVDGAKLVVNSVVFPNSLIFDDQDSKASVTIQNCTFHKCQVGYPKAKEIIYDHNTFSFDGNWTKSVYFNHNAYPLWFKAQESQKIVLTNNTGTGYLRGFHINSQKQKGSQEIIVNNNTFKLANCCDDHSNKRVAFQLVDKLNGNIEFQNNNVDAYMGVCFYKGIVVRENAKLTIQNNHTTGKLYGSNEWSKWNSDTETEDEQIAAADAFAKEIIEGRENAGNGSVVTEGHTHNYENGVCTICGQNAPSSGGPSSGSSGNKTETTTNPDGSTTTTVTKPDGSKTETTKYPDGSKEVVETKKDGTTTTTTTDKEGNKTETVEKPDGSSVTKVDNKDGSGSTTTVSKDGETETTVRVPRSMIEEAGDDAVQLQMPEAEAAKDANKAPSITVDLPSGETAKVEIPVKDVTAGTVAILVKEDGTEEIIKTTVMGENGVIVTLSDGDTVKIVDNSKDFADVSDSAWYADAIDFVTSRELFNGTSDTMFSPGVAMTRGMIVTVLARLDGEDTTDGATWYEAERQWAMENGISDGSNMMNKLTREQLVTMLYRYAQYRGLDTATTEENLTSFADAAQVSGYAVSAMNWAVGAGVINGTDSGLAPKATATRAEVAQILMNFDQKF